MRMHNRIQAGVDCYLRKSRVISYPTFLIVEPSNICNLKCPLCPTGQRLPTARGTMTMSTFTRIVDQLHRYVRHVNLFYLGEPLLCKDLHHMIRYAKDHRMRVTVSSNLNIFDEGIADRLIDSRLDHLVVSLDGTNQETYAKYRVGGDFNEVMMNMAVLTERKRRKASEYPRIILQFVVFKHNEAEVPEIQKLGKQLGVYVLLRQGALGGEGQSPPMTKDRELASQWLTQKKEYHFEYDYFNDEPSLKKGACDYLWKVITINWDGTVFPCCWAYDGRDTFGNIVEQDIEEIWNNERFRSARALFSKDGHSSNGLMHSVRTLCHGCKMYTHHLGGRA